MSIVYMQAIHGSGFSAEIEKEAVEQHAIVTQLPIGTHILQEKRIAGDDIDGDGNTNDIWRFKLEMPGHMHAEKIEINGMLCNVLTREYKHDKQGREFTIMTAQTVQETERKTATAIKPLHAEDTGRLHEVRKWLIEYMTSHTALTHKVDDATAIPCFTLKIDEIREDLDTLRAVGQINIFDTRCIDRNLETMQLNTLRITFNAHVPEQRGEYYQQVVKFTLVRKIDYERAATGAARGGSAGDGDRAARDDVRSMYLAGRQDDAGAVGERE